MAVYNNNILFDKIVKRICESKQIMTISIYDYKTKKTLLKLDARSTYEDGILYEIFHFGALDELIEYKKVLHSAIDDVSTVMHIFVTRNKQIKIKMYAGSEDFEC